MSRCKTEQNAQNSANPSFDISKHIPPSYDIFGYLKPINKCRKNMEILTEKDQIKIPWNETNTNHSKANTRTELVELRRKERIPDISYDLDKDGYVGQRDFVISKLYDADNDGKLNEIEAKNAYEGISQGIENKYIWNIDNEGGQRPFRLLQKRGKFVDAEDFLPVRETYPMHPISKKIPKCQTLTQLKEHRKKENMDFIQKQTELYQKNHPNFTEEPDTKIEEMRRIKPMFRTFTEIKEDRRKKARSKCGLLETETHIKDVFHDPSLEYVVNPKHKTLRDFNNEFYKEKQEIAKKLNEMHHKDEVQRLNEREDEVFARMYSDKERKTYKHIKEKMRLETNAYNMKVFSNNVIGIHGHELPKFAEHKNVSEFWKNDPNYKENPKFKSLVEYQESIKYWKPEEELYLNEHRDEFPQSVDPFKKEHHVEIKKADPNDNVILKVGNLNLFKGFDPNVVPDLDPTKPKTRHIYRWTSLVDQFSPGKFKVGRFFDFVQDEKIKKEVEQEVKEKNINIFNSEALKKAALANKEKEKLAKKKAEEEKAKADFYKETKDPLYHKFSNKENSKNIPKGVPCKTNAF